MIDNVLVLNSSFPLILGLISNCNIASSVMMRSNVMYQMTCLRCKACYVGGTTRHLRCRFSEHKSRTGCSVKEHIKQSNVTLCDDDVIVLGCNNREDHLFTLEAIFQHEIRPKINGKEEFKTKTLSIIF